MNANPFAHMFDCSPGLQAHVASKALTKLTRKVCRPLEKAPRKAVDEDVAAFDAAVDAGLIPVGKPKAPKAGATEQAAAQASAEVVEMTEQPVKSPLRRARRTPTAVN